ncbi:MAG TPA: DUF11 domain-containing protein [Bacteroidota bacterium]|nr:DUF11 domain-containing protein [Bacteroidota bacterium]
MNNSQLTKGVQINMKNTLATLVAILAMSTAAAAQTPQSVDMKYPHYTVSAVGQLQGNPDSAFAPLLEGKSASKRFGILYKENASNLSGAVVLELIDAANNQTIKKITLDEYYGKENSGWKYLPNESQSSARGSSAAFSTTKGKTTYTIYRDLTLVDDANLPGGKRLDISFAVKSSTPTKLKARFLGTAEGVFSTKGSIFTITGNEKSVMAALVVRTPADSKIVAEAKKGNVEPFTVTSGAVSVSSDKKAVVLSMNVTGTSTPIAKYMNEQVQTLRSYLETHGAPKPKMVQEVTADETAKNPGDTVVYTVTCDNIGTAPAAEIQIQNRIPAGARYIEDSAEGEGSDITIARNPAQQPQIGAATAITWKFKTPFAPGEERLVKFKVVLL